MAVDLPGEAYLDTLDVVTDHLNDVLDAGLRPRCAELVYAALDALEELGADLASYPRNPIVKQVRGQVSGLVSTRRFATVVFKVINLKASYRERPNA